MSWQKTHELPRINTVKSQPEVKKIRYFNYFVSKTLNYSITQWNKSTFFTVCSTVSGKLPSERFTEPHQKIPKYKFVISNWI